MDIGFWEIFAVFVVALLVLRPEHIPETARKLGQWIGSAKRTLKDATHEVTKDDKQP